MRPYCDRKTAKLRQESQYYTGLPCKNGHVTYRYTSSGSCAGCVRAANGRTDDPISEARKEAKGNLIQVRVLLFDIDREAISLTAWAMAVARYPELKQGDIDPHLMPSDKSIDMGRYAFNCHPDDLALFKDLAARATWSHKNKAIAEEEEKRLQKAISGHYEGSMDYK